jgi:patatin-related protein
VAQELFNLVKSTAPGTDPSELRGSAKVYRDLAVELGARYVVDILSGTSAGGINAVFLAKALANDQSLEKLEKLWVEEADISRLINDKRSKEGVKSPKARRSPRPPRALLNGARMYEKLLKALGDMRRNNGETGRALVKDLDLFVTATDLQGLKVPIRLADELAYERRYRHDFHFRRRHRGDGSTLLNDFKDENNEILAFAARCTSSFPFAFEPVLPEDYILKLEKWKKFFERYLMRENEGVLPESVKNRAFADGGYLDNKPFSYAIETIPERFSDIPVDRKLLYVEPSPEKIEPAGEIHKPPNALENTLKAFSLARYETIGQDLELIRRRNTLLERAERILRGTDADLNQFLGIKDQPVTVLEYFNSDLDKMIERQGFAYSGYLRLRVSGLTDDLSLIIASQAGFALDSDEFLAIRYLVRSWRDDHYAYFYSKEKAGNNKESGTSGPQSQGKNSFTRFIIDFDLGFNVRRLDFVIKKIDSLLMMDELGAQILEARNVEPTQLDREELQRLRSVMSWERERIRNIAEKLRHGTGTELSNAVLKLKLTRKDLMVILEPTLVADRLERARGIIKARDKDVQDFNSAIKKSVRKARKHMDTAKEEAGIKPKIGLRKREEVADSPLELTRWVIAFYIRMFPHYDLVAYPILHTANVGKEINQVEVFRVSPRDPDRLAGSRMGHFGGFFDRTWRKNDILRGRLDGARKIITSLLPGPEHEVDREEKIQEAHIAIMEEIKECPQDRLDLLGQIMLGTSPDDREAIKTGLVKKGGSEVEERLAEITMGGVPAESLREKFESFEVDKRVEASFFVRSIARAIRVVGKMLKTIGDESGSDPGQKIGAWVASVGAVATGLVEVLLPGNWLHLLGRRWLSLLMLFGILLLTLNALFDMGVVGILGGAMVGGSAILLLLSLSLGRAVRTRKLRPLLAIPIAAALILLVVGVAYTPTAIEAAKVWVKDFLGI